MRLLLAPAIATLALFTSAQDSQDKAERRKPAATPPLNARYELGWRVRRLERAWAANTDVERRKFALPQIEAAVQHFFGLRLNSAAEALDQAAHEVLAGSDGFSCNAANAWVFQPERRLLDLTAESFALTATLWYSPCVESGSSGSAMTLAARLDPEREPLTFPGVDFGERTEVRMALAGRTPGDVQLTVVATDQGFGSSTHKLTLSIVEKRDERLAALEAALDKLPDTAPRLERETGKALLALLKSLAAGSTEETDYPGARLLAEAEQVVAAAAKGERWYGSARTGQFWLAVPTSEKRSTRARIFVPALPADAPKPPLVVALHGAGGSENMFFDGYGDGEIVRQCETRKWMLVAPRVGFGSAPVAALVDELATRFAFDPERVFVVGHSMGAAAGTSVVLADPTRYAAFVALGGGQAVKDAAKLAGLPIFIGAGERDFGLAGAKSLRDSLLGSGAKRVLWREYANTEHLLVVPDALPDVFAWLTSLAGVEGGPQSLGPQRSR